MENIDELEILNRVLAQYGLSLEDREVYDFFYQYRERFDSNPRNEDNVEYGYCREVRPSLETILPSDFENSGYYYQLSKTNFMEWFRYRNSGSNPLVWKNIGDREAYKWLIESLKNTRKFHGPLKRGLHGQLFNGEDANHRALTLIINHFLESMSAKTEQEKNAVNSKYSMTLPVAYPLTEELKAELKKISRELEVLSTDEDPRFPKLVTEYRARTFENYDEAFYLADYDPESKVYHFKFNGEEFMGSERKLLDYLKTRKQTREPILRWESEGVYYISCYNMVWKSKNKEKIEELYPILKRKLKTDEIDLYNMLEVHDLDTNTYDITYPSYYFDDQMKAEEMGDSILDLIAKYKPLFFDKLQGDYSIEDFIERFEKSREILGTYDLPDLVYTNLTKQEAKMLKDILLLIDQIVTEDKWQKLEDNV
ncbi:MAG: hypothetical protein E7374_01080 [Clostridiales bacterium]|nr:hypothetical protein [Clostridiales bacterium]